MSAISTDTVLVPHLDDLISTLHDLDPIVATLAGQRPMIESLLEAVNQFLIKIANNVTGEDVGAAAQAQYIWTKGLTTPSGPIGDEEPPIDPTAPPTLPVAGSDPGNSGAVVTNLVGSILGLLGTLPDITLPVEVCDQLHRLQAVVDGTLAADLRTQLATLCPADGSGGADQPTTPPTVPLPLPPIGGGGDDGGGGTGGVPLGIPGVGG
jgi:hypothetical protein